VTPEQAGTRPGGSEVELEELIARLADNKYFLGRRYAEWCTAAPTLESAVAAAAMAQDEIGHARSFYPLLREVAPPAGVGDPKQLEPETRTAFLNVSFLDDPFESWTDFIAANLLFDTALTVSLESAVESSCAPLAQRARRILEEEQLHWLHAEGWTRRLAASGPAARAALAGSFSRVEPDSLGWFDVSAPQLVATRVVSADAATAREAYCRRINGILEAAGLTPL
jgi:phenylacetate-CoA oxygenase PaaI subunit